MKKVSSAALLAIKLTWKVALAVFLLTALLQTGAIYLELMPGGVPLQTTFGFEALLQTAVQGAGKWWIVMLMVFLTLNTAASRGSKTIYTMNRLGLSEMNMTFVFGGVFSLYFLLYWVFQLGMAYGFFAWYSRFSLVSSNAFMLACWRSEWLHLLLPLGEWLGYVRNIVICLSFGLCTAFGAQRSRHGKQPLELAVLPIACLFLLQGRVAESLDLILIPLLIACTVGEYFLTRGGAEDEIL